MRCSGSRYPEAVVAPKEIWPKENPADLRKRSAVKLKLLKCSALATAVLRVAPLRPRTQAHTAATHFYPASRSCCSESAQAAQGFLAWCQARFSFVDLNSLHKCSCSRSPPCNLSRSLMKSSSKRTQIPMTRLKSKVIASRTRTGTIIRTLQLHQMTACILSSCVSRKTSPELDRDRRGVQHESSKRNAQRSEPANETCDLRPPYALSL